MNGVREHNYFDYQENRSYEKSSTKGIMRRNTIQTTQNELVLAEEEHGRSNTTKKNVSH